MTVAEYIKDDLKARIESGNGVPEEPTLKNLALHYKASVTPVRHAIKLLVKERLILKNHNGRLMINPSRVGTGQPHLMVDCPEPRKDWYRVIADDVVRMSFEGKAVFLREEVTARKYGISRTVVRQVFSRLAGSGIFEHLPHQGWRIRPFRYEDVEAFFQVREAMELMALELARPNLVKDDLEKMLADTMLLKSPSGPVDDSLHKYLIEKSHNRYIQDFSDRCAGHYRYRTLFDFEHDEVEVAEAVDQHRRILEAILAEDWQAARETLSRHIRYQVPAIQKMAASILSSTSVESSDGSCRRLPRDE